jgi:hypothetical protein
MAQYSRETMELADLSKGMNLYDPETKIPAGYYVDAQNMLLTEKSPVTVGGLTKLNTTAAPGDRIVYWAEPYTPSSGTTHIITFLDDGVEGTPDGDGAGLWSYTIATDTWTPVWVQVGGANAARWSPDIINTTVSRIHPPIISVPFRGRLLIQPSVNASSATTDRYATSATTVLSGNIPEFPLKYDGTYASPVGSFASTPQFNAGLTTTGNQWVARFLSTEGTWSGGTERTAVGMRKEGTSSRELVSTGSAESTMTLTYSAARDFLTGLLGATDLTTTDYFVIWIQRTVGSGTVDIRIRFGDTGDTAYFEEDLTVTLVAENEFTALAIPRSNFATGAGSPVWSSIAKLTIGLDGNASTVQFDAAYWAYELSPTTSGRIIEMYNQQLVHAGSNLNPTGIEYSDAGSIDYFDSDNTAQFTGGRNALEETDQVTALWSYFDELIVGKPNSAWTFSGAGTNTSISALPLTIGIGGPRAISETPWSLHYYYDGNIFGARLTSRGLVSTNISSELALVDNRKLFGVTSIRDDGTHTVRWGFATRGTGNDETDLGLIYDYQLDAWASRYTPEVRQYTRWVSTTGDRELLAVQYDGFIRRVDVGTGFEEAALDEGEPVFTAIESYVDLPWTQAQNPQSHDKVVQWLDLTVYLKGTADVLVRARFADEPHEFSAAAFTTYGTVGATPDGDKGYVYLGVTSRWIQIRLYAAALSFEIQPPLVLGYNASKSRV